MIALAAAAALSLSGCQGGLCGAQTLRPLFEKLAAARGGIGRPVHIIQIGDSHSAGDAITGAWRDMLQARYGSGGRGVLPPGRPYDGYLTYGVTVSTRGAWNVASDFGRTSAEPRPALGLSAFSLTSGGEGAGMAIDAEPRQRFTRLVVCALLRPGAGALRVRVGDAEQRWELGSITPRPGCRTFRAPAPATHAELASEGGPVTLTSWATFADAGGAIVSNLGVVGSQLVHFGRTDDAVLAEELRTYQPDLIVIEFGTNEGFAPRFVPFEQEVVLRSQIARLRRLAGNVPILLIGAPDALTRRPELRANAPGGDSAPCGAPAPAPMIAAAPDPTIRQRFAGAMEQIGDFLGVTSAGEGAPAPAIPSPTQTSIPASAVRAGLFPPAGLSAVREVQRRVAASLHVAYWDWQSRMGGRCTSLGWARATPPLMRGDYVHYTRAGGREVARLLQADLDAAAK